MSNVKLAIRVRPFTDREQKSEKDRIPVVDVADDHTVTITNTKVSLSGAGDSRERIRRYYADYTFDSACAASLPEYASQEKVFETIGRDVIASVARGNSACVMAYGQSATGKTHTMMGTDAQPGLVPRLCRALADMEPSDLTVSFLEIYNERVHDLLVEATPACHSLPRRRGNARKDLRVREHPARGPYVQNLRRVSVSDIESLLTLVSEGTRRRRTAPTRRNSTSSRSHALLDIVLPHGTLHLADLAGSEKASWEGCGGGRQKEGANINKSLVALSNVISALVSSGNGRGRFVPYRDSALTWLLKDCFTGGASTFIIATVSPSIACYGESASTLRWAERARRLPTPKHPSAGVNVASKAVLQAQFNQLIAELSRNFIQYTPETGKISYDDNHWDLHLNKDNSNTEDPEAKIGSIMNRLSTKPEANSKSVASSVTSESSDVITTMDKNIKIVEEINKEVDKLFVPSLERTSSSTELKVVAPLRHKRRQYRSQEILPLDDIATHPHISIASLPSPSQVHDDKSVKPKAAHVPILHESQRAEIVASVTDRLYSRLKKKEEAAVTKVESIVDRKIMEPLSELRICTNARQRLMELSQKAMRNKRRIGIPAYTQTRVSVIRVKDQGIDVQTDLDTYIAKNQRPLTLYRDVGTETIPMTPRCKEIAVGSKYGTLNLTDRSTITDNKKLVYKNSFMMTDVSIKREQDTQTPIIPPPRRKRRSLNFVKRIAHDEDLSHEENAPVISINISQTYPVDSESQSSDDSVEQFKEINPKKSTPTPDLLSNHCETNNLENEIEVIKTNNVEMPQPIATDNNVMKVPTVFLETDKQKEEFTDLGDCTLPRVTIDPMQKTNSGHIKNMIMGRNANMYPYNIVLSPPKERDTRRIVTFQDDETNEAIDTASQTDWDSNKNIQISEDNSVSESIVSNSTDSSKMESDSFIWRQGNKRNQTRNTLGHSCKRYTPAYKNNPRYRTTQARFYREFLGLENNSSSAFSSTDRISDSFSSSDNLSLNYEDQHKYGFKRTHRKTRLQYENIEQNILDSCNDLDDAVSRYNCYLNNFKAYRKQESKDVPSRTPTEYLQHLVKLRREVVKAEGGSTDTDYNH